MHIVNKSTITAEAPLLLVASTAVAAITACVHLLIVPMFGTMMKRHAELDHYQTIISSENGYKLLKKEITDKIDTLNARLIPLPEQKNIGADPGSYLETLIAVARKSEVRFARMQPQEERRSDDLIYYPILLNLTSTFHELGQFITSLEKMPSLFSVDRLGIEATENGKCDVRLLVTCLIPKEVEK